MAFPYSYVNGKTLQDLLTGTISFNWSTNTFKVALFTDAVTGSNKDASESYGSGAWGANEVVSTGYTAGGKSISGPSLTTPSSSKFSLKSDTGSLTWTGLTCDVAGALVYNSTVSNRVLAAIRLPEPAELIEGTLTVNWDPVYNVVTWMY